MNVCEMSWCWCANDFPFYSPSSPVLSFSFTCSNHTLHPLAGGGVDCAPPPQLYSPLHHGLPNIVMNFARQMFGSNQEPLYACFVPCGPLPLSVCIVTLFELCALPIQPTTPSTFNLPEKTRVFPLPSLLGVHLSYFRWCWTCLFFFPFSLFLTWILYAPSKSVARFFIFLPCFVSIFLSFSFVYLGAVTIWIYDVVVTSFLC
jgi:hypothetical protein